MPAIKTDFQSALRVLRSRSSYGAYGLVLLSVTLLLLKWRGFGVAIPTIVIILYPLIWTVPVLFSSYLLTNSKYRADLWPRFTYLMNTIGGALWFGYVHRCMDYANSVPVMELIVGLFVLLGTISRLQIMLYWFAFVVGEGLAVMINNQTLINEDMIVPVVSGVLLYWGGLTSDFIRHQIERNKALVIRSREDSAVIRREQSRVQEQTAEVERERRKVEELLRNILPEKTAEELKVYGRAEPKTYGMVTVLFTDFKDFTTISERISPELLVKEIDVCFSAFDDIMERHHIEKIKTVGDAYIAAAGLPEPSFNHAANAVGAALDIISFMRQRMVEKQRLGEVTFEIRIGIHTGPLVAGIVGKKKFAYDIWGDTVNMAARMEQSSEAAKINISGATYHLVKDVFDCEYRGKIDVKNKGQVDSYFVRAVRDA